MKRQGGKPHRLKTVSAETAEHYIGRRAVCRNGILGTVTRVSMGESDEHGDSIPTYYGVSEDGRPWQSVMPTWVQHSERRRQVDIAIKTLKSKPHGGSPTDRAVLAALQFALGLPRIESAYEGLYNSPGAADDAEAEEATQPALV